MVAVAQAIVEKDLQLEDRQVEAVEVVGAALVVANVTG